MTNQNQSNRVAGGMAVAAFVGVLVLLTYTWVRNIHSVAASEWAFIVSIGIALAAAAGTFTWAESEFPSSKAVEKDESEGVSEQLPKPGRKISPEDREYMATHSLGINPLTVLHPAYQLEYKVGIGVQRDTAKEYLRERGATEGMSLEQLAEISREAVGRILEADVYLDGAHITDEMLDAVDEQDCQRLWAAAEARQLAETRRANGNRERLSSASEGRAWMGCEVDLSTLDRLPYSELHATVADYMGNARTEPFVSLGNSVLVFVTFPFGCPNGETLEETRQIFHDFLVSSGCQPLGSVQTSWDQGLTPTAAQ